MKIIVCGNMYADVEKDIRKMKASPPVSDHKFEENLTLGLFQNKRDLLVINVPKSRYFPHYPDIFIKKSSFFIDGNDLGHNVGYINLPLVRYLTIYHHVFKELKNIVKKYGKEQIVLVCYNQFLPIQQAMVKIKQRNKNVKICSIVGDLQYRRDVVSHYKGVRGIIIKFIENRKEEMLDRSDMFGLLTEPMRDILIKKEQSYRIMEGMYHDSKDFLLSKDYEDKKTVFYAGAINKQYDILHLLRAFSMIQNPRYQLKIAGIGDCVEIIKKESKKDARIRYLGMITPAQVKKYQSRATVLISPRCSNHNYVNYSFPSKTMECLASGKPFIAHKLPCVPPEYDAYIQYPANESDEALSKKIVECCELSRLERDEIGRKAREFILTQKNPEKQCAKLVEMFADNKGNE